MTEQTDHTSLSDAILDAALAEPSDAARQIMRLSLLDWTACALAGRTEPVAQITRAMALEEGGAPQASLLGGGRAPARAAALVNGATSHALDYDDTHFAHIGHPSVAVIPAALATAQREGLDLNAVLDAALAGCEASIRFGLAFGRTHYQIGYHQTATAGAFGAAVAAAQLLGLTRVQMHHVIGAASTRASGLKSQFGTMGKPYNAGIAASNGIEAALLVAGGFLSNPEALIGQNGFLETHHGAGQADQPPGFLMETISHKFHACCHGLHATLEALETLKPIDPATLQSLQIATHPRWLSVCNIQEPQTGLQAKFSYRCVSALSLLGHETGALTTYRDALAAQPATRALMDKVQVSADDSLSEMQARITLTTKESEQSAFHDLEKPLSLETLTQKIKAKTQALLGPQSAADVSQAIAQADISALTSHF